VAAIHRETVKIKEEFHANMVGSLLEVTDESIRIVTGGGGEASKNVILCSLRKFTF